MKICLPAMLILLVFWILTILGMKIYLPAMFILLVFWILTILIGMGWHWCFMCSLLVTNDIEHLFICIHVSCLSHVWLCYPMNCSLPGSSVHGILQARILEWVVMPSFNLFMYSFVICISSLVKCLCSSFAHFQLSCLFCCWDLITFFAYFGCKSFIIYVIYKYLLTIFDFSFSYPRSSQSKNIFFIYFY